LIALKEHGRKPCEVSSCPTFKHLRTGLTGERERALRLTFP
jgi:hypothetical protein